MVGCFLCIVGGYGIVGVVASNSTDRPVMRAAEFSDLLFQVPRPRVGLLPENKTRSISIRGKIFSAWSLFSPDNVHHALLAPRLSLKISVESPVRDWRSVMHKHTTMVDLKNLSFIASI
jgi:hypothetical protein